MNNSLIEKEQVKLPIRKIRLIIVSDVEYVLPKNVTNKIIYDYDYLLQKSMEVHGNNFDYSKITRHQVKGYLSMIIIICNNCECEEEISVSNHLNNNGCKRCKRRILYNEINDSNEHEMITNNILYNYNYFLQKTKEIHGEKFNYSKVIKNKVNGEKSEIIIICNDCAYEENITIKKHLTNKKCNGCKYGYINNSQDNYQLSNANILYNYNHFMKRAKEVHGNKFNYSKIVKNRVDGLKSIIIIICNNCGCEEEIKISCHLKNKGCKKCKHKIILNDELLNDKLLTDIKTEKMKLKNDLDLVIKSRIKELPQLRKRYIKTKYNYDIFIYESRYLYENIFDYSLINNDSIINKDCRIDLICNVCTYKHNLTIKIHMEGKGCRKCRGSCVWYYDIFVHDARLIHGDKYDYSKIDKNKTMLSSEKFPIKCNNCKFEWSVKVNNHIGLETGCPNCVIVNRRYNIHKFLKNAEYVHGNKYDYSKIDKNQINSCHDKIEVTCNLCHYEWTPVINDHIYSRAGCPRCSGCERYTLSMLLERTKNVHGDKYNYSFIKQEDIKGKDSKILVICNNCNYEWHPKIHNHIYHKGGCPKCSLKAPWIYDELIKRAIEIHGNKYNYSLIKPEDIKNVNSRLDLICNNCSYEWSPSLGSHINSKCDCPQCMKQIKFTVANFKQRAIEIHGEKYDYGLVTEDHIKSNESFIPIKCNKCCKIWSPSITNFINNHSGCPRCKCSKGELKCLQYLETNDIIFKEQFSIHYNSRMKYDFMIDYENEKFLLEFDGLQHFEFIEFFFKNLVDFNYRQEIDIQKTIDGINNGYKIIRIDYDEINNIQYHLDIALNEKNITYFSNQNLYSHIIDRL